MNTQATQNDSHPKPVGEVEDRKIIGLFHKQRWEGKRLETLVAVETVTFDATRYVVAMNRNDIVVLEDNDYGTDNIGSEFVDWPGPHGIEIVEQIKLFFGIEHLHNLTDEMLDKARAQINSQEMVEECVVISIKVNLRIPKPTSAEDRRQILTGFVENMDYFVESNSDPVKVSDTELLEWS